MGVLKITSRSKKQLTLVDERIRGALALAIVVGIPCCAITILLLSRQGDVLWVMLSVLGIVLGIGSLVWYLSSFTIVFDKEDSRARLTWVIPLFYQQTSEVFLAEIKEIEIGYAQSLLLEEMYTIDLVQNNGLRVRLGEQPTHKEAVEMANEIRFFLGKRVVDRTGAPKEVD